MENRNKTVIAQRLGLVTLVCFFWSFGNAINAESLRYVQSNILANNQEDLTSKENAGQPTPEIHFVKMHLSGSGCTSCISEMEHVVKSTKGVQKIEIYYPGQNMYQYYSPTDPSWSSAEINYDASSITLDSLLQVIKKQGYTPYKIQDKAL